MIGLKVRFDPMAGLRSRAELKINEAFNAEAQRSAHLDQEYAVKRAEAARVLSGGEASPEFQAEASLTGVSVKKLAGVVSKKPDTIAQRGLRRRTAILAARNATTPAELEAILNGIGLP